MFIYTFQAHPTWYKSVKFRSRLEATWAAFFDLAGWEWSYEPIDLEVTLDGGRKVCWTPDFYVKFPCGHSECRYDPPWGANGHHELYVEVKPYSTLDQFKGHVVHEISPTKWDPPHAAMFGLDPSVSEWTMSHGSGGGIDSVDSWVNGWEDYWATAGNLTRYQPVQHTYE